MNITQALELTTARLRLARLDQTAIPALLTDLDALLETLRKTNDGGIHLPSHYTPKMAADDLGISHPLVHHHCRPGGRLEPEIIHGQKMIPAWRIVAFRGWRKAGG